VGGQISFPDIGDFLLTFLQRWKRVNEPLRPNWPIEEGNKTGFKFFEVKESLEIKKKGLVITETPWPRSH
jgi:hypothetical protein